MLQSFGGNSFQSLYVCVVLGTFAVLTKSDDIQMNTAIVTFSEVTISSWNNDNKTAKFKDVVAVVANGYCSRNNDKCALRFWNITRTFRNSDVTIASYYPKQVEKDIEIRFYVVLPSGVDIRKLNSTVLPKGTLDGIIEANSTQIGFAVDAKVKRSKGDNSTTKPKTDGTMDYIMIPLGFGLLIFVIVLACCLHYCHKRKIEQIKKEERRQFLLQQKSESSKQQSPFQAAPPVKQIPEVAVKPQQRQEQRFYYENEQDSDQDVNEKENGYPPRGKKRHENEDHIDNNYDKVDGSYFDKECEKNVEDEEEVYEESDHERRHSKRKRKKKRRHKKQGGSPHHEYDQQSGSDEDDTPSPPHVLEDDDISSRLPPPRKLPPLRGQTTKL